MTEVEVIPAHDDAHDDADGRLDGPRAWCHVMYGLHALSAVFGILTSAWIVTAFVFSSPSIIAVIINYATRGRVRGTWLETHWRWQMRTFWFALVWVIVAGLLVITIIGYPLAWVVALSTGLWVLYRVIRGWLALADRSAMPLPVTRPAP
jgi:uncharacterized membrane protein